MPINVTMPVLGLTMEQGTIQQWLKREGDAVQKDEPLVVVETDKAAVEVPSPASGRLQQILAPEGKSVPVTHPIAVILGAEEDNGDRSAPTMETAPAAQVAPGKQVSADAQTTRPTAGPPAAAARPAAQTAPTAAGRREIRATPLARKIAREFGLDLAAVRGSGPEGRIQERDVRAYAAQHQAETAASSAPARPPLATSRSPQATQPLTRIRALTAERMAASARSVARVTLFAETDFSEAARFRHQLAPDFERRWGARLSYDAIIARACALALVEHPDLNSQWTDGALRNNPEINLGLAVQTEQGLLAPVLRRADQRPLHDLAREAAELIDRARAGKARPDDLAGGTFTITNLGGFGVDAFTPIVNPPEAAILGVGRIAQRPVVVDGAVAARETAWLSLSFDHRVADGVPAAQFLQAIRALLENPYRLLA